MARDTAQVRLDILVRDDEGRALLVAEVKHGAFHDRPEARDQLERYVAHAGAKFGMLVDDESIVIAPVRGHGLAWDEAMSLSTRKVLGHYATGQVLSSVEGFYLTSLVQAWLRDFAIAWHSSVPPGSAELAGLGLPQQMRDAEVAAEVAA